jgi:hypothetical protein
VESSTPYREASTERTGRVPYARGARGGPFARDVRTTSPNPGRGQPHSRRRSIGRILCTARDKVDTGTDMGGAAASNSCREAERALRRRARRPLRAAMRSAAGTTITPRGSRIARAREAGLCASRARGERRTASSLTRRPRPRSGRARGEGRSDERLRELSAEASLSTPPVRSKEGEGPLGVAARVCARARGLRLRAAPAPDWSGGARHARPTSDAASATARGGFKVCLSLMRRMVSAGCAIH